MRLPSARLRIIGILCLLSSLGLPPAPAEARGESLPLQLSSGTELSVQRFAGAGDRILWLPSEFGFGGGRQRNLALQIAERGFDVWVVDLHSDYFEPPGRESLSAMPVEEISELIMRSQPAEGRLFVMSTGRGGALSMLALRRWQRSYPDRRPLGGLILFHPNLLAAAPKPDRPADYLPVAELTNLPVYIIQPEDSGKRWYLEEVVARLRRGGSDVYARLIPGVSDGFHLRSDASEEELKRRREIPGLLAHAVGMLSPFNREPREPPAPTEKEASSTWEGGAFRDGLQPYDGPPLHPPLILSDTNGRRHDLSDYRGKVVLLNFWTTWCPPCVEEIPSLGRLGRRFAGAEFSVLSVDIGEKPAAVEAFLERVPAAFPVLLDSEGASVRPWRIRAFPTTFVIDRAGRIRYSYFGALEWDTPEVVAVIESLLSARKAPSTE